MFISNIYYNIVNNENFYSPVSPHLIIIHEIRETAETMETCTVGWYPCWYHLHSTSTFCTVLRHYPTSWIIFPKRHHTQQSLKDHFYFHLLKTKIYFSPMLHIKNIYLWTSFFYYFILKMFSELVFAWFISIQRQKISEYLTFVYFIH